MLQFATVKSLGDAVRRFYRLLDLHLAMFVIMSLNIKLSQMFAFINNKLWMTPVCACGTPCGGCSAPLSVRST